jgi:hypothetical protein
MASSIAMSEMFRLKRLNDALLAAGRPGETGRATSISSDSVPEISLAPLTPDQFIDIVPREMAIGRAVGERYARLAAADDSEQNLLDTSDRGYHLLVELLGLAFAPPPDGAFLGVSIQPAIEAMSITDGINTELTRRGLLPPFTPSG